jgi:plastocyanin
MPVLKQKLIRLCTLGFVCAPLLLTPALVQAQDWRVQVGAQSHDKGQQLIAFLPNELWIHAGDSVSFTVATDEPHTVTFLTPGQLRPPFPVGCPGTTSSGSPEDGSSCVNSGTLTKGQKYSVTFPTPGDYKLVCLYHQNHTAMIHVLALSAKLPHLQAFYSAEAADMERDMLSSAGHMMDHDIDGSTDGVTAGTGVITATGGGSDTLSVMRFMHPDKIVRVGETVEWTNDDPITPHTVTFGVEPAAFRGCNHGPGWSTARHFEFANGERPFGLYCCRSAGSDRIAATAPGGHPVPCHIHAAGYISIQVRAA